MHTSHRNLILLTLFVLAASSVSAAPSQCPTYIDTVVPSGQNAVYGRREPGDPFLATMRDVHNTLSRCSGIKSLKLRVTGLGCSEWPDRWSFPFDLSSSSRYPSKLESLDLEGCQFDDADWREVSRPPFRTGSEFWDTLEWLGSGRAWKWLRWLPLSRSQKDKTNLHLWLEAMDFSHIKELALKQAWNHRPELQPLIPHLQSLRSLNITGQWARDFILGLPADSLTHLAWHSSGETGASVLPVLRHHARSLTSLDWRQPETGQRQRRVMSPEQIAELGRMAPSLETLTLDVNRNGTWPMEHLEALATSFPKVATVTVFFEIASECRRQLESSRRPYGYPERPKPGEELPCSGIESMAQPLLNNANAVKLFGFLRENKVGEALTKAVFYAGDWSRGWDGPIAEDQWLDGRAAFMFCEAVDEGAEGSGGKQILCQGIDTKIASSRWGSGYDEIFAGGGGGDDNDDDDDDDDDYNRAWTTDLAKRARWMELLD